MFFFKRQFFLITWIADFSLASNRTPTLPTDLAGEIVVFSKVTLESTVRLFTAAIPGTCKAQREGVGGDRDTLTAR